MKKWILLLGSRGVVWWNRSVVATRRAQCGRRGAHSLWEARSKEIKKWSWCWEVKALEGSITARFRTCNDALSVLRDESAVEAFLGERRKTWLLFGTLFFLFFLCSCLGWGAFEGRGEAFGLHLSDSPAEEIQMLCVVTFDTEKSLLIKKTFIHGEGNARDIDEEHQADLIQHYTSLEKSWGKWMGVCEKKSYWLGPVFRSFFASTL